MTSRDTRSSIQSVKARILGDPRIRKVHDHWVAKHHGSQLPARRDIDPIELAPCLSHVMILDVISGGRDFVVRLAGQQVEAAFGCKLRDRTFTDLFKDSGSREWLQRCRMVAVIGEADFRSGDFADLERPFVHFDSVILPLADDGRLVTHLLCCYRFSESGPAERDE